MLKQNHSLLKLQGIKFCLFKASMTEANVTFILLHLGVCMWRGNVGIYCTLLSTSLNVCNAPFIIKHVEKKEKGRSSEK